MRGGCVEEVAGFGVLLGHGVVQVVVVVDVLDGKAKTCGEL